MKTLFEAIYARFQADSDLSANVTDMYFDEAPDDAVFPYIVFSLIDGEEEFDSDNFYEDAILQFNIFSDEDSPEEVTDLFEYLKGDVGEGTGFDFFSLEVENYTTLILERQSYNILRVDDVWLYNVTYRCLLNYTGESITERFYGNLYNLVSIY